MKNHEHEETIQRALFSDKIDCRSRVENVASTDQLFSFWSARRSTGTSCPMSRHCQLRPMHGASPTAQPSSMICRLPVPYPEPADLLPRCMLRERLTTSSASGSISVSPSNVNRKLRCCLGVVHQMGCIRPPRARTEFPLMSTQKQGPLSKRVNLSRQS